MATRHHRLYQRPPPAQQRARLSNPHGNASANNRPDQTEPDRTGQYLARAPRPTPNWSDRNKPKPVGPPARLLSLSPARQLTSSPAHRSRWRPVSIFRQTAKEQIFTNDPTVQTDDNHQTNQQRRGGEATETTTAAPVQHVHDPGRPWGWRMRGRGRVFLSKARGIFCMKEKPRAIGR